MHFSTIFSGLACVSLAVSLPVIDQKREASPEANITSILKSLRTEVQPELKSLDQALAANTTDTILEDLRAIAGDLQYAAGQITTVTSSDDSTNDTITQAEVNQMTRNVKTAKVIASEIGSRLLKATGNSTSAAATGVDTETSDDEQFMLDFTGALGTFAGSLERSVSNSTSGVSTTDLDDAETALSDYISELTSALSANENES